MQTKYVIVQHSAAGYSGDPNFARGIETRAIETQRQLNAIIKAGGLVFDSYKEATEFEQSASYPDGYTGLIPNAQGKFSELAIDGLRVYIPVRKVVG